MVGTRPQFPIRRIGKDPLWNVAFERQLPFASIDIAYVSNRVNGALGRYNINVAQTLGGGGLDRPC